MSINKLDHGDGGVNELTIIRPYINISKIPIL